MICFPNAKINIGLNVLEKREDGYHNIESIFYPIQWCDAMEALPVNGNGKINTSFYGNPIPGTIENNLCVKAYNLLNTQYNLPSLSFSLLKSIPMGAGLGGGSSDAAFFLQLLNDLFALKISTDELKRYASLLGSDCIFFIDNKPSLVTGTGNIVSSIELNMSQYYFYVIYPQVHIDTKNAYSLIKPHKRNQSLKELIQSPVNTWKETIVNDFEEPIFKTYPELAEIKNMLYKKGALYASMTGSGSALYGIFNKKMYLGDLPSSYKVWSSSTL